MPCKPTAPPPLTVIIDTREQEPWSPYYHDRGKRIELPVIRRKLDVGDYSVEGWEHEIAIERKSLADWVGTTFGTTERASGEKVDNWDRFRREIERAKGLRRFWIFIEATRGDVYGRKYHSRVEPQSVLGRTDSLEVDHGVSVLWCGQRSEAERMVGWFLRRFVDGRLRDGAAPRASESTG
jgi:hypothetical protein